MTLRAYQSELVDRTEATWASGLRNIIGVLPTGSGKSVTVTEIARRHYEEHGVAIAHRSVLIAQISLAFARAGLRHDIVASKSVVKTIVGMHMEELGANYYTPGHRWKVASVDTLPGRMGELNQWARKVTIGFTDESHHLAGNGPDGGDKPNKWIKACNYFDQARWFLPTATPERADGKGLGRNAHGIADAMIEGPGMRWHINNGYLTNYVIRAPLPADLDLSDVQVGANGEYNQAQVRKAVHRSGKIVGNVVDTYLLHTRDKLGIVFAVDIEHARDITKEFNTKGVTCELITAEDSEEQRRAILKRYRNRETLVLVNVDLFGEGFDLPAIEVVMFARPTASYGLYCLDPETEVLTPNGWKKCDEALQEPHVLAFNPQTGLTELVNVEGSVKRPMFDAEKMYSLKSPHADMLVSDKHRLLVKAASETSKNWLFENAENSAKRKSMYRIPVAAECDNADSGLSVHELHLLGWFMSDGSINKKTNALSISQSANKDSHLEHIRSSIRGCGLKFGEYRYARKNVPETHSDQVIFTISHGQPRGTDKHLTGWARLEDWLDKSVPSVYDSLSSSDLRTMLRAWNLGDGLNNHSSIRGYKLHTMRITCGDNKQMADRLQQLCVTRGLRCNISVSAPKGVKWYICYIKDVASTTVAGLNDADSSVGDKKPYRRSRLSVSEDRPEFVWCLANRLGTLITRRNGKVAIVGNCQQFGRGLRLMIDRAYMQQWENYTAGQRLAVIAASPKPVAHIHDHVGNVLHFFGPPDKPREWSLDARAGRRSGPSDAVPLRVCLNPMCMSPFERFWTACPMCGMEVPAPVAPSAPEQVDGDIQLYTPEMLRDLFGVDTVEDALAIRPSSFCAIPPNVPAPAVAAINKRHQEKLREQSRLAELMQVVMPPVIPQRENHRKFFLQYGVDVVRARTLGAAETTALNEKIMGVLTRNR